MSPSAVPRLLAAMRAACGSVLGLLVGLGWATAAFAHAGEGAFVLLLPTGYYLVGGTLAVAISFLVLLAVPRVAVLRAFAGRPRLGTVAAGPQVLASGAGFAVLVLLIAAGLFGSRDPLANPLPLTVWTLGWGGLTIVQALVGDLWALVNPWVAPYRLVRRLLGGTATPERPPLAYPGWLSFWPATAGFLAFAWFELVDPAPDDPARLAAALAIYTLVTVGGMLAFGERAWLARAECFSIFFRFVALLAPLRVEPDPHRPGRRRLGLALPGAALVDGEPLSLSGVAFVLLTLATVSFDGLSQTFRWLALGGVNPLEFPGRTAMVPQNTLGLLAAWVALVAGYGAAVALGAVLAGGRPAVRRALAGFALSILPVSVAYHFAHYLTAFLVNVQYAIRALGDPFARGWDLLGLAERHVTTSFLSNYDAVSTIWKTQAGAVVLGHLVAVAVAHRIAVGRFGTTAAVFVGQLPLALLMIAYTLFGLWLLAAPAAG